MIFRTLLVATTVLTSIPALAAIDPPASSTADGRIRTVTYDPSNPVEIYTVPGATLRIELGGDETVEQVVVSDQDIIAPDPNAPPPQPQSNQTAGGTTGVQDKIPPTCDADMCRAVVGNIVYIKPIRPLAPQPLFIQTSRSNGHGGKIMIPYAFELSTRSLPQPDDTKKSPADAAKEPPPDAAKKSPPLVWGVKFVYPDRVKAAQIAAWQWRQQKAAEDAKNRASMAQPAPTMLCTSKTDTINWKYVYRGAKAVEPDEVCDDGRTTYIRYDGNRRVPNIYSRLPDHDRPTLPASSPEPDATGTTLRVAGTQRKWFIWDGDLAGCLFDGGPDPEGRASKTVATGQEAGE